MKTPDGAYSLEYNFSLATADVANLIHEKQTEEMKQFCRDTIIKARDVANNLIENLQEI